MMYLNGDGGATAVDVANAFGTLGLNWLDTSRRRKAEYAIKQKQTDVELGLKEKLAKEQADLKKLELAVKSQNTGNKNTVMLIVAGSSVVLALFGVLWYVRNK